jgi:cyclic beta-1,2-glucan synthetase
VSVELKSAIQSDFTRIFAGQGGIDPYGGSASDVYQDLYGSGSFIGKGLIDVDAYYRCLDKRFPTDRILSTISLRGRSSAADI